MSHKEIFTPQYVDKSGPGSTEEFSAPYRVFLEHFIEEHEIRSITDLGCGDMEIMSRVDMGRASYVGIDVIEERIRRNRIKFPHLRFHVGDLREFEPASDLVLCKDVIQHWATGEILVWLGKLVTCPFRYALITNCNYTPDPPWPAVNADIDTGGWRPIDLTAKPFSLGRVVFAWGSPRKNVVLVEGARYAPS